MKKGWLQRGMQLSLCLQVVVRSCKAAREAFSHAAQNARLLPIAGRSLGACHTALHNLGAEKDKSTALFTGTAAVVVGSHAC